MAGWRGEGDPEQARFEVRRRAGPIGAIPLAPGAEILGFSARPERGAA